MLVQGANMIPCPSIKILSHPYTVSRRLYFLVMRPVTIRGLNRLGTSWWPSVSSQDETF